MDKSNLTYLSGFLNEFATEALPGALPQGQNSPQKVPYGLYAEQLSGTSFTAPRATNRRSWLYRIMPSAAISDFRFLPAGLIRSGPFDELPVSPSPMRWDPFPLPEAANDFIDGLFTIAGNGDVTQQAGIGIHGYAANIDMADRFFFDADGELLIVPEQGRLVLHTEFGLLEVEPGEIVLIPRGVKFKVDLPGGQARGYVCENYGASFRLPELGPLGSNALASPLDFFAPVAAYEDREGDFKIVQKF